MDKKIIVPRYWSESKAKVLSKGRTMTVKRFGWSDVSELDATEHSKSRLDEALHVLRENGDVRKIDHKVSYNGGEGIPIREEVVSKQGDIVISRNAYGALCLNTPDVMFADIDLDHEPSTELGIGVFVLFSILSGLIALYFSSWFVFALGLLGVIIFSGMIAKLLNNQIINQKGGLENEALRCFEVVSEENANLHMRIYKTTMGFRILFMEDTHDPSSEETLDLLRSLNSDRLYIQMCRNQQCFRARVSPKPWRIGVDRLRPRPGVWPIKPEHLNERQSWIDRYTELSVPYSSCKFVKKLGSDSVSQKAEQVRKLHDELCKVDANNGPVV